jgi:uncharacterized protein
VVEPLEKEITFGHGGTATQISIPGSRTLAILLHGMCVDRDEFGGFYLAVARHLAQIGISSVRFDFAGHGTRSDEIAKFSIAGQFQDCCELLDDLILSNKGGDEIEQIIPIGTSFGSPPAVFLSNHYHYLVDRVVLVSPVLDYNETFIDPIAEWGIENFGRKRLFSHESEFLEIDGGFKFPVRLFYEMELIEPLRHLSASHARFLIFHGEQDSMVPVGPAKLAASGKTNVFLRSPPSMDHGPIDVGDPDGNGPKSAKLLEDILSEIGEFCL